MRRANIDTNPWAREGLPEERDVGLMDWFLTKKEEYKFGFMTFFFGDCGKIVLWEWDFLVMDFGE